MTKNKLPDGMEQYPTDDAADELEAQKKTKAGLYRMREIISGLLALAEDGSVSSNQVRQALQKAFKRTFS